MELDFLKDVLGEDLFKQVEEKLNTHNGDEANKEKQIKLFNLASGEYVGKGKYDGLQTQLDSKTTELTEANKLIEQLKKSTTADEKAQEKITAYETQVGQLQEELRKTQQENAVKMALLSDGANPDDIDYLMFSLERNARAKGISLELDDTGTVKNWDGLSKELKTQHPGQYKAAGNTEKKIIENKLPDGKDPDKLTRNDILKMSNKDRTKLYEDNPDAYNAAMGRKE